MNEYINYRSKSFSRKPPFPSAEALSNTKPNKEAKEKCKYSPEQKNCFFYMNIKFEGIFNITEEC